MKNKKFDLSNIEVSKADINRNLILPEKPSKRLAEFIGILTGDGYMNLYDKHFYFIEIAGDSSHDFDYLSKYVYNLIFNLFNIEPKIRIRKDQNSMDLRICSKGLLLYLDKVGFVKGRKEQIGAPNWILENDEYILSFIKGLADTDFSLALLNKRSKMFKYYPRVSIISKSKLLIKIINNWLVTKNFKTYVKYDHLQKDKRGYKDTLDHGIQINGRKNLSKWMNLVSFRNSRHLLKYENYMRNGPAGI